MAAPQTVTVEYSGNLAIVTLDNQEKLNALSQEDYYKLASTLREIAQHDEVLVTLLIGKGRFFSAGADITRPPPDLGKIEPRQYWLRALVLNNIDLADAFYTHPKILVTALNGPVLGLSAAVIAHSDFIFATPKAYLLTPFSSLGLVTEGGASLAFVRRLGVSKAKEALLSSRRIPVEELQQVGFVNQVLDAGGDEEKFKEMVLSEIRSRFGDHLVGSSVLEIKRLLREPGDREFSAQAVQEVFGGLRKFVDGVPQAEFKKIATGQKRHKL
ncbi:ClpP/crotonase-like domain-containing protein [Aspergillus pseudotamarii]|uniref:ClpP/crotonase-like domain-containing protein n=1 Tax=Aspergillus pseudotamarii TaxID=132259 RepID=A0A5N6T138_ASPPS|nr:ClpP/crotonase-like domain-containing protein [Aspergillus pseudotamarii]KAE8139949.1 ClpP/crotonase-like domain-containing protein [Aspergillus pseudotamarii]